VRFPRITEPRSQGHLPPFGKPSKGCVAVKAIKPTRVTNS
jgi:hypothetical protein